MSDDVVAALDRWLAVWSSHFGGTQSVDMEVVQRARDEIVALREALDESVKSDPDVSVCGRLIASHPIVIPDLSFENMKAVNAALAAAERRGAEAMRERAASATAFCCFECSRVIRALSLTPEEP